MRVILFTQLPQCQSTFYTCFAAFSIVEHTKLFGRCTSSSVIFIKLYFRSTEMPLLINDYTWKQTDDLVFVRVPLKGVLPRKVDLFTSDVFIKVHFPPYLFEACLFAKIDEDESTCVLSGDEAVFQLKKVEACQWPELKVRLDKKEQLKVKQEAIERAHAKAKEEEKKKADFRNWRQKTSVSEQISIDSAQRKKIDRLKKEEKEEEIKSIEDWKSTNLYNCFNLSYRAQPQSAPKKVQETSVKLKKADVIAIPGPRKVSNITVTFTPRAFPTPCRESKLQEEQEWLKKQAEARRLTGFVAEDLRPEENDPQWLLDKGQSFYSYGNYLGAVSAYTHGIGLCDKMPELYVARSTAQVAIGNHRRAIKDATQALEMLKPHTESNLEMRFDCHYNRGRALLQLGLVRAAESDLEEAVALRPDHQESRQLFYKVELMDEPERESVPERSFIEPSDLH